MGKADGLLYQKLVGTQPLGLLGVVKVRKPGLPRPRRFPVFLVAALGRSDSEHDATRLWRCRVAVFEVRVGFRAVSVSCDGGHPPVHFFQENVDVDPRGEVVMAHVLGPRGPPAAEVSQWCGILFPGLAAPFGLRGAFLYTHATPRPRKASSKDDAQFFASPSPSNPMTGTAASRDCSQ